MKLGKIVMGDAFEQKLGAAALLLERTVSVTIIKICSNSHYNYSTWIFIKFVCECCYELLRKNGGIKLCNKNFSWKYDALL